jgi:hypothetical protein
MGLAPVVDTEVEGSIQFVLYTDGRVQFAVDGCFKTSPKLLADVIEALTKGQPETLQD